MNSSVSVVIPAWNAGTTIDKCLDSLMGQSLSPYETILVNDGSDDDTVKISRSYPVKVLDTGGRKGPAAARNMGAEEASGGVILFLDADVTVPEDLLEKVTGTSQTPVYGRFKPFTHRSVRLQTLCRDTRTSTTITA